MIKKHILLRDKKKSILNKRQLGTEKRPRLSVFRSNRSISAQLIDDKSGKTLVSAKISDLKKPEKNLKPQEIARLVGQLLAQKSLKKNIKQAIFDRRGYKYHGNIKSLADGAREEGLKI